jgi:hypothetical protein
LRIKSGRHPVGYGDLRPADERRRGRQGLHLAAGKVLIIAAQFAAKLNARTARPDGRASITRPVQFQNFPVFQSVGKRAELQLDSDKRMERVRPAALFFHDALFFPPLIFRQRPFSKTEKRKGKSKNTIFPGRRAGPVPG